MPLRIAFDLDGVLADMEGELARLAEGLFGRPSASAADGRSAAAEPGAEQPIEPPAEVLSPLAALNLSPRQQRRLWHHVESIDGFWEQLKEIEPGVVKRLATVAVERRWEVIFLTKRPESAGATAQLQTQRWLQAHGFTLPSVYVVQGSRGRIAAALAIDIVIDDRPENCLDVVVDSKARAILVWRFDEGQLPPGARRLGIGVVKTVRECLDILSQVDRPRRASSPA